MVELFAILSLALALATPLALKVDGRLIAAATSLVVTLLSIYLNLPLGVVIGLAAFAISLDTGLKSFGVSLAYAALATVLAIYVYYSSAPVIYSLVALVLVTAATYGLLAMGKTRDNIEAAVKYVVFSGVGKSLIVIGYVLAVSGYVQGVYLIVVGFMFELGIAPFHAWVVDTYALGSPRGVAALVVFSKVSSLFVLLSIFRGLPAIFETALAMLVVSMASMFIANIAGLTAKTLGRIMAYSSIAHMSYVYMALALAWVLETSGVRHVNLLGVATSPFYLAALVIILEALTTGLAKAGVFGYLTTQMSDVTPPRRSVLNVVNIFSLLGLPPLLGFWPKLFLILLAVAHPNTATAAFLVGWVVLNSVIATPYYLRAVRIVAEGPAKLADNITTSYTAFVSTAMGIAVPLIVFML